MKDLRVGSNISIMQIISRIIHRSSITRQLYSIIHLGKTIKLRGQYMILIRSIVQTILTLRSIHQTSVNLIKSNLNSKITIGLILLRAVNYRQTIKKTQATKLYPNRVLRLLILKRM